jgi:hypothetical protein
MAALIGPQNSPMAYFALLDEQSQKEEVLKQVSEEAAARFKSYRESVKDASALRELPARQRMSMYEQRAPEIWQRLQSLFPIEYRDQMQDWYHLQRRIALAPHPEAAKSLFERNATSPLPDAYTPNGGVGA